MQLLMTKKESLRKFAGTALFNLGFRPFFLGAGVFAVLAMLLWWAQYSGYISSVVLTPAWHAHEMLFGYTQAVIVGFLLTSVRNWTGRETVSGARLFGLFCCWAAARVANALGYVEVAGSADLIFMLWFGWCAVTPIIAARQWRQTAIVGIVIVMTLANGLYYAGQMSLVTNGIVLGNYIGYYVVIGLILVMTGRVMPLFIQRGVTEQVQLPPHPWLERLIFVTYIAFALVSLAALVTMDTGNSSYLLAAVLFILNLVRLGGWHTVGIWQKPLLWSLYLAYGFIVLGFLFYALLYFGWFSMFIPLHLMSVGGIGLLTLSMMARVSLGHSGRSIHEPPLLVVIAFATLVAATLVRVFLPVLFPTVYLVWIEISQMMWIVSFGLFVAGYAPILARPRIDNMPG